MPASKLHAIQKEISKKDVKVIVDSEPIIPNFNEPLAPKIVIEKEEKIKMAKLCTSIRLDLKKDMD